MEHSIASLGNQTDNDIEQHLRRLCQLFFTDTEECYTKKHNVRVFCQELIDRLKEMKEDLEARLNEKASVPANYDPPLSSLWLSYVDKAKQSAFQLQLSARKTSPAITCYLSALVVLLWKLLLDKTS